MERLLAALALGALLAAPVAAGVREDAAEDLARLRGDRDLYVGEAVAESADAKALAQARADARAALALSVQSVIRAKVTEKTVLVDGVAKEELRSESSAEATVQLRNLAYREYADLPKPGQVTVVASITREDYRRMLAGLQLKAFHPENGVMAGLRYKSFAGFKALLDASQAAQAAAPDLPQFNDKGKATVGPAGPFLLPMVELHHHDLYAGFGWLHQNVGIYAYDEAQSKLFRNSNYTLNGFLYEAGWDWTFWDRRLQCYLPLRLQAAYLELRSESATQGVLYPAWCYAATAGLGARFWANEKLALDGSVSWALPLNQAQLMGDKGPLRLQPGQDAPAISADGLEMKLNLRYSGF